MVKLVQINCNADFESTGKIVNDINSVAKGNNIVSYIAYQISKNNIENGILIGNKLDWKCHALFSRITSKQGFYSYFSTKKFLNKLDEIKPDIIHLHNLHANYINLPLLLEYCGNKNIKTILTLHDTWFFTGKCCHFLDVSCDKYKHGCNNCPKKKMDYVNYFKDTSNYVWNKKRDLFQNIKNLKVIGCSKWIADRAKESDIFKDKYISYIHNGIDTDVFTKIDDDYREKYNLKDKFVILSFANKWCFEQNNKVIENIIEYAKNTNSVILLIGCNDNQREQYKSNKNIIPIGFIKNKNEMANIYNTCDVFVNLTLMDTLPTVNMESLACGTPVICYADCGGGAELIKDNMTGYVIPKFDSKEIVNAIEKIKKNSIDRDYCVNYAKENFDKEKNYMKYIYEYLNW